MRKKFMIFVALFIFFFGINNVDAMTLKPAGASSAKKGEEITLYITLNRSASEKTISAVDGTLSYDSNVLQLISSSNLMTGWTQFAGVSNGSAFGYGNLTFDNLITSTNQNVVKMVFKVNSGANSGNTTLSISNPSATDEVGDSVAITGGTHNVKILSDVNTLSGITISNGTINFNENTTEYNLTIDSNSTNISATKKDSSSSISGDVGSKTLNYGVNTFKITVTSESGKSKVYTINITRPDNRSSVNTLKSLVLSEGEIDFSSSKTSYNVSVSSKTDSIKITSSLTDDKSRYIAGSSDMGVKLDYGVNTVKITIQAENGSSKTYTIKITRKDDRSKDNTLKEIKLPGMHGGIIIDNKIDEYEIKASYNEKIFEFEAITNDNKAKVEIIGDKNIKVGINQFEIKVTAENGDVKTYKLNVIRQEEDVILSSDSSLKSLVVTDTDLSFDKNKKTYTVKTKKEKLEIEAIAADKKSKVEINNNFNLEDGSVISIIVTAEDGTSTRYEIIIEKDKGLLIPIASVVLILLVVGILVIVILKKKKSNKEQ